MQADMVGDFLLRVSVLSLSNAKIKDLTLLFWVPCGMDFPRSGLKVR
jgi:hypothetical protein